MSDREDREKYPSPGQWSKETHRARKPVGPESGLRDWEEGYHGLILSPDSMGVRWAAFLFLYEKYHDPSIDNYLFEFLMRDCFDYIHKETLATTVFDIKGGSQPRTAVAHVLAEFYFIGILDREKQGYMYHYSFSRGILEYGFEWFFSGRNYMLCEFPDHHGDGGIRGQLFEEFKLKDWEQIVQEGLNAIEKVREILK